MSGQPRKKTLQPPKEGQRVCSPSEAAAYLGISIATFYRITKSGQLVVRKIGRRSIIALDALDAFLEQLPSSNTT